MTPLTSHAALTLSPEQAADLIRVLDLQAAWENHRDARTAGDAHGPALRERQRRYDAFRAAQSAAATRLRPLDLPEAGSLGSPERLAGWCRAVLAACRRAGADAGTPADLLGKAYRLADRIAARQKAEPVGRDGDRPAGPEEAVARLEAVAGWCDALGTGRAVIRSGPAHTAVGEGVREIAPLAESVPLSRQAA